MLRRATLDDLAGIVAVEQAAWPATLAMDASAIRARLETFPAGQLVEEEQGQIVAYAAAQRLNVSFFEQHRMSFAALTDGGTIRASHDEKGEIYQLIGVGVMPRARGSGLARALVDRQIEQARQLRGVRRIVGFTRPVGYHRHRDMNIEQYVRWRTPQGQVVDPVLAFHLMEGAKLVAVQAGFRPEDTECGGYGVLIEYGVEEE